VARPRGESRRPNPRRQSQRRACSGGAGDLQLAAQLFHATSHVRTSMAGANRRFVEPHAVVPNLGIPPRRVTQTLREVSMAREANVLLVSSYHGRGPDAEEYSLPGRQVRFGSYWPLFLNQLDRHRAQGFRPSDFVEDTGEETIVVAGRSVAARRWTLITTDGIRRETTRRWTLWLSEEVPGGLARVEETTGRSGPGAMVISTVEVEAFAGQRTGASTLFADSGRARPPYWTSWPWPRASASSNAHPNPSWSSREIPCRPTRST